MADISLNTEFYVATGFPPVEERIRVLKYGSMFAVFDRYGNIRASGLGEHGLYFMGTRFLSRWRLSLGETPPLFLSSCVRSDNTLFSADLTNVDILSGDSVALARGSIHLVRSRLLWNGVWYEVMRITNYGASSVHLPLRIEFAADFADVFEVRGVSRPKRGKRLQDIVEDDRVILRYQGLDEVVRSTEIRCSPAPEEISAEHLLINTELQPRETARFQLTICCDRGSSPPRVETFDNALSAIMTEVSNANNGACRIYTSNHQFNNWLSRSQADVLMMTIGNPETDYPYAGVPWFSTVFGRDGIITAMECLWQDTRIARGVLHYLASTQALEHDPDAEAEPGKIVHETRHGEMAALGEIPFGRYYGSVDSTPLFVMLAGLFYQHTGDLDFIRALWPNIDLALSWIDLYGDRDHDGFVEYERQSSKGLIQQGWKDSSDSVFHADGTLAEPPIALCEVQGYVYAAKRHAATLARALGDQARADVLERQASALQKNFEEAFWCDHLSTYALALDGQKKPCQVRTSNAGQCLFSKIASTTRANQVAQVLLADDSFSGWGVRTVSALERKYNPISYHNGSVWPHDNAILALGMAQYGLTQCAALLLDSLFEASVCFEMNRFPELICGLHRRSGEGPTLYPVACSPQAWSAGAVFMLVQACLGMSIDAPGGRLVFNNPSLPQSIASMQIENLRVGGSSVSLVVERHAQNIHVEVSNKSGPMDVIVSK